MVQPVVIADYDPKWPSLYEEEKARILGALGTKMVAIEHIGSTAVPGLAAKAIIDMMVGVAALSDAERCIGPMITLGYRYRPEMEDTMPERRYFTRGGVKGDSHHLHMVQMGSPFWERHLLFRNYLRTHGEVAQEYQRLKLELAARYGTDRDGYSDAKTPFIRGVEEKARGERPPSLFSQ